MSRPAAFPGITAIPRKAPWVERYTVERFGGGTPGAVLISCPAPPHSPALPPFGARHRIRRLTMDREVSQWEDDGGAVTVDTDPDDTDRLDGEGGAIGFSLGEGTRVYPD